MIQKKKKYKLVDFDYALPLKFIAQYASKRRDLANMMVVHRDTCELVLKKSPHLPNYFRKNDLFLINTTKHFPARFFSNNTRTDAQV